LATVLGSVTPPGRLRTALAAAAAERAGAAPGVQSTLIDLAEKRVGRPTEPPEDQDNDTAEVSSDLIDHVPVEAVRGDRCHCGR
jgi:hypothetical protein